MRKIGTDLFRELGIIVLIGFLPIIYAYLYGGANILEQMMLKLAVDSRVIFYFLAGALVFFVIAWLEYMLLFRSAALEGLHKTLTSVLMEGAITIAGILRIIAGALFGFLVLVWSGRVSPVGNIDLNSFIWTGALAALFAYLVYEVAEYAKRKWLHT